jgi:PAS domain S-box-containing protein
MSQTLRILVIDDNPDDRMLAIREVERAFSNLQIQEIINAKELEQAIDQGNFDIVITDYQLGWSNGLTVLRAIKAAYPNCPVIMFTNSGTEEIAVEAMKAGLDDYVIKSPKHFVRLARAVRSVLERVWQQQALKESETRYHRLFEGVPVGLYRTTPSGELLDANPALVEMLGYADQSLLLMSKLTDFYVDAEVCELWQVQLAQGDVVQNFEVQLRRGDGRLIWVLNSTRAIRDDRGQLLYYEGAIEDITERQQAMAREKAARSAAETANKMKDEFLATLSHELRTPLNAILGWAKLLRSRQLDKTTSDRALETIERNAVAQTKLIEDMLDVSRIIRGQLRINPRSIDLGRIITTAMDTIRPAAEAKQIYLTTRIDPAACLVIGDPDRLQQIVWNLLSNAIKFTPRGEKVEIKLLKVFPVNSSRLQAAIPFAQIEVSDTGMGIDPQILDYIFEPFRQGDGSTTRSHGGLGLGLSIVRQLVELHGGTIQVKSLGKGQGATFIVQLPILNHQAGAFSPPPPDITSVSLVGLQVLVVDDDADSRSFISTVLEHEGAKVITVASVQAALQAIQEQRPDVLISDIGMPHQDGYDLIHQLRQQEAQSQHQGGLTPPIPALALTAYARELDREAALKAGFQMHISKPVDPEKLVNVVAHLGKRD